MMSRRVFLGATSATVICRTSQASGQPSGKTYRIVGLGLAPSGYHEAFYQKLSALGFVDGRNVVFERRFSEGNEDRNLTFAAELVRMNPDLIIASYAGAAVAAKRTTSTIPIVMVGGNPERLGLVANLSQPGGNLTGISNVALEWGAAMARTTGSCSSVPL